MSMQVTPGDLLQKINYPSDLKQLTEDQLEQVCQELRQYIIDVVSVNGGHFAASLGEYALRSTGVGRRPPGLRT
jgi:1-deoxy-D-xylulose-5-phosphate synthase